MQCFCYERTPGVACAFAIITDTAESIDHKALHFNHLHALDHTHHAVHQSKSSNRWQMNPRHASGHAGVTLKPKHSRDAFGMRRPLKQAGSSTTTWSVCFFAHRRHTEAHPAGQAFCQRRA
ncbi:hypothetical protein DUNSADRAFT_16080 [Dunaliella salina]|uniref:Encoded protein n=1 Tax=Dunaliella salina TaxID=3046 RepID=A0ABQ7G4A0_DUNSA|nr:hypothetical protein DUNSADRAFT_16080 [Dunaliella salina]|eukprot:KAF5829437.1 hypothetical protein DUNSADRAFT_16080 [Dunaliella salina]